MALPGSLVLHLIIIALLIFGLPVSLPQSQSEQAIAVDLVPPPKPPEKAKVEPPPPAKEIKPEKPKEARRETAPVINPVVRFGEKDAGPRKSPDGDSAEDGSEPPTPPADVDEKEPAEQPPNEAAAGEPAEPPQPKALETPTPTPKIEAVTQAPQPKPPDKPALKPAAVDKVQKPAKLREAKTLFSRAATGDTVAITAMAGVPRGVRAGRLCLTELREQLRHGSPSYVPELLPSYSLDAGTIMEVRSAAFRVKGQWYDLAYRCEIDEDATKVESFAIDVGNAVPRGEWERRGLPSQ